MSLKIAIVAGTLYRNSLVTHQGNDNRTWAGSISAESGQRRRGSDLMLRNSAPCKNAGPNKRWHHISSSALMSHVVVNNAFSRRIVRALASASATPDAMGFPAARNFSSPCVAAASCPLARWPTRPEADPEHAAGAAKIIDPCIARAVENRPAAACQFAPARMAAVDRPIIPAQARGA